MRSFAKIWKTVLIFGIALALTPADTQAGRSGGGGGGGASRSLSRPSGGASHAGSYSRPSGGASRSSYSRPTSSYKQSTASHRSSSNYNRPSSSGRVPSSSQQRSYTSSNRAGSQLASANRPGGGGSGTQGPVSRANEYTNRPGAGGSGTQGPVSRANEYTNRPGAGGSGTQGPVSRANEYTNRPGAGGSGTQGPVSRASEYANRPGAGGSGTQGPVSRASEYTNRPGARGSGTQHPNDVGNFLGISAGAAAGASIAASQLPTNISARTNLQAASHYQPPSQRTNWNQWSQNRNDNWQQAVNNRQDYWDKWSGQRQQNVNDFQKNQGKRWNEVEDLQKNRQDWISQGADKYTDWRVDNREDWQDYRTNMWDYRWDRADNIWDDVRDYRDDLFDDHWWRYAGYYAPTYTYPANPWWWWVPTSWNTVSSVVTQPQQPVYYDYGVSVIYEGDQVYRNGQPPIPAAQYNEQAISLAEVPQPPPPQPAEGAASSQKQDWMPLGVWALTQQDKGDAVMFMQLSVNKEGLITGGYQNVMTNDSKQVAGSVDKQSQRAAWRIGDNSQMVIETGIFNLTKDVTPVLVHFGKEQTQTWLMVRLPAPEMPGAPTKVDATAKREMPPVMGADQSKSAHKPATKEP